MDVGERGGERKDQQEAVLVEIGSSVEGLSLTALPINISRDIENQNINSNINIEILFNLNAPGNSKI